MTGITSYHAGLAAEDIVARTYAATGLHETYRRWRCAHGEIDLILGDGEQTVFVEVKKSKDFAKAAARVTGKQITRIWHAATAYLSEQPLGLDSPARVDVALVDGSGAVEILENVTMH